VVRRSVRSASFSLPPGLTTVRPNTPRSCCSSFVALSSWRHRTPDQWSSTAGNGNHYVMSIVVANYWNTCSWIESVKLHFLHFTSASSRKHNVTVWHRPSVCLSRRHTHRDSPKGSMWRGQRTFRSDNKEDRHTCYLKEGRLSELLSICNVWVPFPVSEITICLWNRLTW